MNVHLNRFLVLAHRWGGTGMCVLVVLWFFSGIVMLYVGYPKLTPAERLAHVPVLDAPLLDQQSCCVSLSEAWQALPPGSAARGVRLTIVAGTPTYRFELHHGLAAVDASSGKLATEVTSQRALDSARAFMPGVEASYVAQVDSDIWTRGSQLNAHRPLHRVQMQDEAGTVLYVSSKTAEVVRDAPRWERRWNFVGPWLHWLHMFRSPEIVWRSIIFVTCAIGLALAATGIVLGISRWRFRGRFPSGRKTPYREPYMRWHHLSGLIFSAITLTWLLSGLLSINPWGLFGWTAMSHNAGAEAHSELSPAKFSIEAGAALAAFTPTLQVRELEWHVVNGKGYFVGRDVDGATQLLTGDGTQIAQRLPTADVVRAAESMRPGVAILAAEELKQYDDYYYSRAVHTLRGHEDRPLPVVRVQFDDEKQTWAYFDPRTGADVMWQDAGQRSQRWWFVLLHSWDSKTMLASPIVRDVVLIVLCVGGLAMGVTGSVIGFRRLRNRIRA
jgi:hypothetical protein